MQYKVLALFLAVCLVGSLASPLPEDDKKESAVATGLVDTEKVDPKDDLKTAEFWGWGGGWGGYGWGGWGGYGGWGGPWGGWGGFWG